MKKFLSILSLFATLSTAKAQIQYKLTRLPDNITYMVSIVPQATWSFPQNVVTTAQVTVRVPVNSRFIAGRITTLVPTTQWMDNAYLEHPVGEAFLNNMNAIVNCENATKNEDLNADIFKITKLYPVPAQSELQVEWQANDKMPENVYLIVHNVLGEVVFKQLVKNTKTLQINKLDVSEWSDGMYTLQLQSQKSISIAKTFVVYHLN